jgi:hypothetical protein
MIIYYDKSQHKFYLPRSKNAMIGKIVSGKLCEAAFYQSFDERKIEFEALEAKNKVVRENLNNDSLEENVRKEYEQQMANIISEYSQLLNKKFPKTKHYPVKMRVIAFEGSKQVLEPAYKKDANLIAKLKLH